MKRLILFMGVIFLASCAGKNQQNESPIPEQEKKLREDISQYPDSLLLKENLIQYFRNNGNYGQAIAETEKALVKDTSNGRLWYIKAMLLSENDDTLKAITAWEQTIKYDPRPENLMSLGTLYAFTKNPMAIAMGNILLNSPASAYQGLFIKGLYFNTIGDKAQASALFDQCIRIDYTNVLAYREKAIAEYDMGNYEAAIQILNVALEVKQGYDEALYWRGRCLEKLGKREDAIENYKAALQMSPDYVEPKDALGRLGVAQ